MEKEFKRKTVLLNGKLIKKDNWENIIAVSTKPCTGVHGVKAIDQEREKSGAYFEKWIIKKEPEGFIFREVNHNLGICGHHKTVRQLVLSSVSNNIKVKIIA